MPLVTPPPSPVPSISSEDSVDSTNSSNYSEEELERRVVLELSAEERLRLSFQYWKLNATRHAPREELIYDKQRQDFERLYSWHTQRVNQTSQTNPASSS